MGFYTIIFIIVLLVPLHLKADHWLRSDTSYLLLLNTQCAGYNKVVTFNKVYIINDSTLKGRFNTSRHVQSYRVTFNKVYIINDSTLTGQV